MNFNIALGYHEIGLFAGNLLQILGQGREMIIKNVLDQTAVVTDDMVVGMPKVVIMGAAITIFQFNDQLIFNQEIDGVVDRCHADVVGFLF